MRATSTADGITIRNHRSATIYTFAIDQEAAASANWAPCTVPDRCDGLAPGRSRAISSSDVLGWRQSPVVLVYWWHLVPDDNGGMKPDRIRAFGVAVDPEPST